MTTLRKRGCIFLKRYSAALAPLLQDHTASITLTLSGSEAHVIYAALTRFTAGNEDWYPIQTLPEDREWDIWDNEMSEDVSLARAVDDGSPLFFVLQEKNERGVYEATKWRPAVQWPQPPRSAFATTEPLQ